MGAHMQHLANMNRPLMHSHPVLFTSVHNSFFLKTCQPMSIVITTNARLTIRAPKVFELLPEAMALDRMFEDYKKELEAEPRDVEQEIRS